MEVEDTCLLLSSGEGGTSYKCLLFGFDFDSINSTKCYKTMEKKCASDIEELFGEDGPCGSTHPQNKAKNQKQQGPNDVHGKARLKSVSNQAASKFLQSREDIHLQMMDREDWMNTDCHCIKSTFEAEPDTGCERTLECYLHTEVLIPVENRKACCNTRRIDIYSPQLHCFGSRK